MKLHNNRKTTVRNVLLQQATAAVAAMLFCTTPAALAQQAADTTVVIPATGYLAVKPSQPFSGPANLLIVNTNASNNASTTDLRYNTWRADTVVAMATSYILVGQPGTYRLTFAEKATLAGSSNSGWVDTPGLFTDTRKGRRVYKFVCNEERVGFLRDESCAESAYQSCNFAEDEHFFISTTTAICDKIAAASGKTSHADLDFIEWHGPTAADAATAAISPLYRPKTLDHGTVYDLLGRRASKTARKLKIEDGRVKVD